jgi:capsid protein
MLATIANMATDIHEINNANLRKNKMGAMAAWTYTKGQSGGGLQGRTAATSSTGQPLQKFKEGQIYELEQGSTLAPFLNNQPGAEYAPFMEFNLRMIGMALGLPYEFLLLYFGGGNFASSKASLLQAYKTIETWQAWLESEFLLPVTIWRIAKAVADRELDPAPVDADGVSELGRWEWQRPGVEWIDPQNAIQTEMQEVRIGASDMYAVCARRGRDAEETARKNARYLKMLDRVGIEEGIDPARLHNIQIPGQTPAVAEPEDVEPEDADKKPDGEEAEAEPKKDGGLEKWLK